MDRYTEVHKTERITDFFTCEGVMMQQKAKAMEGWITGRTGGSEVLFQAPGFRRMEGWMDGQKGEVMTRVKI